MDGSREQVKDVLSRPCPKRFQNFRRLTGRAAADGVLWLGQDRGSIWHPQEGPFWWRAVGNGLVVGCRWLMMVIDYRHMHIFGEWFQTYVKYVQPCFFLSHLGFWSTMTSIVFRGLLSHQPDNCTGGVSTLRYWLALFSPALQGATWLNIYHLDSKHGLWCELDQGALWESLGAQ